VPQRDASQAPWWGAFTADVAALGVIALGEVAGWWHMAITWEPYFLTLLLIDVTLCAYVFLVTWRIARRFGWRGLAVCVVAAAIIGPPRDYWYMARFPEWGAYAPGFAPVLAVSVTYVVLGTLGHWMMRLVLLAGVDQLITYSDAHAVAPADDDFPATRILSTR
jgi:hypothetical protein